MSAELYAQDQAYVAEEISKVLKSVDVREKAMERVYSNALVGFAGELTNAEVEMLRKDDRVAYIEEDQVVTLEYMETEATSDSDGIATEAQSTPWGITRVGGAVNAANLSRWAWVIDSGIQLNHPDLTVNTSFARTFVSGTSSATDENGHGTHVAGTIAARNNTVGVIGVAAGATVVPVRVFGASGGSSNSVIISGIDYVTSVAYANDVANMSLGGGASTATDDAVRRLAAKGVYCAIAAGNSAVHAGNTSPARVNGTRIWTISAMDINDNFASFSNYGNPPIDFCAPGVSINSCWIGSGYRSISGTSMATPHVAGILLVNNGTIRSNGFVRNDPDGTPDRTAVR
jgi:subtilisin family serine protease